MTNSPRGNNTSIGNTVEQIATIHLEFLGQVMSKKNSKRIAYNRRTGAPFIRSSDAVKAQEQLLVAKFVDDFYGQISKKERDEFLNAESYEVEIKVYNKDHHPHDLDNQTATIMDALVKAQVLKDDNQEIVKKITAEYAGVDKSNPHVGITIKGKKAND